MTNQPDRETIAKAIAEATIDWDDWGHAPGALAYKAADAVLAILPIPATGEVEYQAVCGSWDCRAPECRPNGVQL